MKKLLLMISCLAFLLCMSVGQSQAYTIDKVLTGSGWYTDGDWSFGEVTLSLEYDAINEVHYVNLLVDLNEESPSIQPRSHVKVIALALDYAELERGVTFWTDYGLARKAKDKVKMGGFKDIYYDLRIPAKGNIKPRETSGGIFSTTIYAMKDGSYFDMDLDFFDLDGSDVPIALHLGGVVNPLDGSSSMWVGDSVPSVPEPATMLLLGFGLLGLTTLRRRFK